MKPLSQQLRVGYVMTHYPRVATTFINSEVEEITRLGGVVIPVAINSPSPEDLETKAAQEASRDCLYLKAAGPVRLIGALLRTFRAHPLAMTALLIRALRTARADLALMARRLAHLGYAALVVEHCRARDVAHLHAHFGQAPATVAWFATEIGNLNGAERWTWSFTIHGFQDFINENDARLDLKAASASFIINISDFTRSQLCRVTDPKYWPRFEVVRCGIDLDKFTYRVPQPIGQEPRFVVVARLSAEKGHVVLLQALADLHQAGHRGQLEIIGSGPYEPNIRAEAARLGLNDAVTFLGELQPAEVSARLNKADIFCLPSFSEGLPVSIMEAMAVGVPVVATAISGIPELAIHDETALTVPPANPQALTEALTRLIEDEALVKRLVTAARLAVETDHDLHQNVAQLLQLFEATPVSTGGP